MVNFRKYSIKYKQPNNNDIHAMCINENIGIIRVCCEHRDLIN